MEVLVPTSQEGSLRHEGVGGTSDVPGEEDGHTGFGKLALQRSKLGTSRVFSGFLLGSGPLLASWHSDMGSLVGRGLIQALSGSLQRSRTLLVSREA